jgi:hypothetical protein
MDKIQKDILKILKRMENNDNQMWCLFTRLYFDFYNNLNIKT